MKLRLHNTTILGLLFIASTSAVPCGRWYSSDCLSDTDIRYDKDASNAIADQASVWEKQAGYWVAETIQYDGMGQYLEPKHANPLNLDGSALPYNTSPRFFINNTVFGSRRINSNVIMYPPAPPEFCAQPVPDGLVNSLGICGITGASLVLESFSTSSYEKDGSIRFLPASGDTTVIQNDVNFNSDRSIGYAVDERTIYTSTIAPDTDYSILTNSMFVFLDDSFQNATTVVDNYRLIPGQPAELFFSTRQTWKRLANEQDYLNQIEATYQEFQIPAAFRKSFPQTTDCLSYPNCPTEENWCRTDPECNNNNASPYQEPDGFLRSGIIVGICAIGTILIAFLFAIIIRQRLVNQEQRIRKNFAARIAETVNIRASMHMLTPQALVEEFQRIDQGLTDGGDGYISKEELWEFFRTGKAGQLNHKDFNALFTALDTDRNGKVDFLEFCSFLSVCGDEFGLARERAENSMHLKKEDGLATVARRISKISMRNLPTSSSQQQQGGVVVHEEGEDDDDDDTGSIEEGTEHLE